MSAYIGPPDIQCRYEAFVFILTMHAFYVRLCLVAINNNLTSIFITRYAVIVITNECCGGDHIDNDRMSQCNATKNNNRQKLDLADVLWGTVETIFFKNPWNEKKINGLVSKINKIDFLFELRSRITEL